VNESSQDGRKRNIGKIEERGRISKRKNRLGRTKSSQRTHYCGGTSGSKRNFETTKLTGRNAKNKKRDASKNERENDVLWDVLGGLNLTPLNEKGRLLCNGTRLQFDLDWSVKNVR
jgi:hypothetical protein